MSFITFFVTHVTIPLPRRSWPGDIKADPPSPCTFELVLELLRMCSQRFSKPWWYGHCRMKRLKWCNMYPMQGVHTLGYIYIYIIYIYRERERPFWKALSGRVYTSKIAYVILLRREDVTFCASHGVGS